MAPTQCVCWLSKRDRPDVMCDSLDMTRDGPGVICDGPDVTSDVPDAMHRLPEPRVM